MELRPGNAGSNTAADHVTGLAAALAQVPAPYRGNVLVRLDGAGASHKFIEHMMKLGIPDGKLLFTCGWTIAVDGSWRRGVPAKLGRRGGCGWSRAGVAGDRCAARAPAGAVTGSRVPDGGRAVQPGLAGIRG